MPQPRVKSLELDGQKFEVRRLPPEVGSFILMRMMGVQMRDSAAKAEAIPATPATPAAATSEQPAQAISGELRVRALSFIVFSGAIAFDDFKFIQQHCMQCVALVKDAAGERFPMPIVSDSGIWTKDGEAIAENVGLVMKLTTEVLILCFADFFEQGGASL
jgi:hypothetical protein